MSQGARYPPEPLSSPFEDSAGTLVLSRWAKYGTLPCSWAGLDDSRCSRRLIKAKQMNAIMIYKSYSVFNMPVAAQVIEAHASTAPTVKLQYPAANESFVLRPDKQFHFENRPIPRLRSTRDVRVRIIATGLCGSDVCTKPSRRCQPALTVRSIRYTIGNTVELDNTW